MADLLKIKRARLSFPDLFHTAIFEGQDTGKYGCTLLLDKEKQKDQLKMIKAAEKKFLAETFPGGVPKGLKLTYWCNGDEKDYDGYAGHIAIKTGSRKRILTLDKDRTPVTEQDNVFYAGCYVNATISFWFSTHPKGGKQLLMNITGIQFAKDGEEFGSYTPATTDDFDEEPDDEGDDEGDVERFDDNYDDDAYF